LLVPIALAACTIGGGNDQDGQAIPAARPETAPCPARELSCGRQTPVISDGVRPFVNDDMGIAALFPRGSLVCLVRSGDAPRGFYARYGTIASGCSESGPRLPALMAIGASFNAQFHRTVREAVRDCTAILGPIQRRLGSDRLALPGHRSLACQQDRDGGQIEITVHALGESTPDERGTPVPAVHYWASLGTRRERLDADLAMFRAFLRQVRIGLDVPHEPTR
jgi:hypothetical protein